VFADLNNDGQGDLPGGRRLHPQLPVHQQRQRTFEDDSYGSGYALNENGRETASMGVAVGATRNNGRLGLFKPTFFDRFTMCSIATDGGW